MRFKLHARGSGQWEESGGDQAKFGLNAYELLRVVERLRIADPYLEIRTGPGRGYPIFHVAARDEWVEVLLRRRLSGRRILDGMRQPGQVRREFVYSLSTVVIFAANGLPFAFVTFEKRA